MKTIERYGWRWVPSIGLFYGHGPNGERETVAAPLMTSPWVTIGSEADPEDSTFVHIFSTYDEAMAFVAEEGGFE
jgi:hypothetical protein